MRYDTRGHGRSGKPDDEASWESERLADDFDAVITGFNIVKPFVVGWYVHVFTRLSSLAHNGNVGALEVRHIES